MKTRNNNQQEGTMIQQQETIKWYTEKFAMKMYGSREEIAKDWVDGCGQDKETTRKIWNKIKRKYYK